MARPNRFTDVYVHVHEDGPEGAELAGGGRCPPRERSGPLASYESSDPAWIAHSLGMT
jgi:hypothetical protein